MVEGPLGWAIVLLAYFFEELIIVIAADGGGGGGRPFGLGECCCCPRLRRDCDDVKLVGALFDAFKAKSSPFPGKFRSHLLKMVVVVVAAA